MRKRRKRRGRFFTPEILKDMKILFGSNEPDSVEVTKVKESLKRTAFILNNPEERERAEKDGNSKVDSELHRIYAVGGEKAKLLSLFFSRFPDNSLPPMEKSLLRLRKKFEERQREGKGIDLGHNPDL